MLVHIGEQVPSIAPQLAWITWAAILPTSELNSAAEGRFFKLHLTLELGRTPLNNMHRL